MLKKMVIPGERIAEVESEDTDDTDIVEPYSDIASIGDIGESADISSPGILSYLIYHHLVLAYHHLSILALMEKLKRRRRMENLFIKAMEKCIFQEI